MPHDPDRLLVLAAELAKPLELYLKWKIMCDRYERGKAAKLAQIIATVADGSYASREAKALASPDYQQYLDEWHEAEKKKATAQVEYDTKKAEFDALQSVLSYERESMKRLG